MLDGAAGAINFYKRALGAEEFGERAKMEDDRILNARVDVNGGFQTFAKGIMAGAPSFICSHLQPRLAKPTTW